MSEGLGTVVLALCVVLEGGMLALLAVLGIKALRLGVPGSQATSGQASPASPNPASDEFFHIALPAEILDYCDKESELFAQEECRARARQKVAEFGDASSAFVALQREDGEVK